MRNKSAPRHAKIRAAESAPDIPDGRLKGQAAASAAPRIIVIALAIASLGAGAAVMSGHGSAGHASAPRQAGHASQTVSTSTTGTTRVANVPWMF